MAGVEAILYVQRGAQFLGYQLWQHDRLEDFLLLLLRHHHLHRPQPPCG